MTHRILKVTRSAEIYPLVDLMADMYQAAFSVNESKTDQFRQRILAASSKKKGFLALLAYQDDTLCGALWGYTFTPDSWWAQQVEAYLPSGKDWYKKSFELNDLFVHPDFQQQSLGRKLMQKLAENLSDSTVLLCTSNKDNKAVQNFYTNLGYTKIIDSLLLGGYDDCAVFALDR